MANRPRELVARSRNVRRASSIRSWLEQTFDTISSRSSKSYFSSKHASQGISGRGRTIKDMMFIFRMSRDLEVHVHVGR
jgi:hypothetical protein